MGHDLLLMGITDFMLHKGWEYRMFLCAAAASEVSLMSEMSASTLTSATIGGVPLLGVASAEMATVSMSAAYFSELVINNGDAGAVNYVSVISGGFTGIVPLVISSTYSYRPSVGLKVNELSNIGTELILKSVGSKLNLPRVGLLQSQQTTIIDFAGQSTYKIITGKIKE